MTVLLKRGRGGGMCPREPFALVRRGDIAAMDQLSVTPFDWSPPRAWTSYGPSLNSPVSTAHVARHRLEPTQHPRQAEAPLVSLGPVTTALVAARKERAPGRRYP